jgi:hypothetical protein
MVKSSRQTYDDTEPELPYQDESSYRTEDAEIYEEECAIAENEQLANTAILLRDRLVKYAKHNGYPLCENLDLPNVVNFIEWVLANPK